MNDAAAAPDAATFGSDVIINWLADVGVRHVALNPGASLRGLHESLVHQARCDPILALHEEIAVGIAHGYWKAAGRPLGVFIHDLVGLHHASMALFNATIDRAAMMVIGGTGPRDETQRRPWLDWIHTPASHGLAVTDVVKASFEPYSLHGVRDAILRGWRIATSPPEGPVYIAVDTALQEDPAPEHISETLVAPHRYVPQPSAGDIDNAVSLLAASTSPVVLVDRNIRGARDTLVTLAETLDLAVIDLGGGFSYPTDHWTNQTFRRAEVLANADLVLAVEVRDPTWAVSEVDTRTRSTSMLVRPHTPLIVAGCAELRDMNTIITEQLVPRAHYVISDGEALITALMSRVSEMTADRSAQRHECQRQHGQHQSQQERAAISPSPRDEAIHPAYLAGVLGDVLQEGPWVLANGLLKGWPQRLWHFDGTNEYLGRSGGEGLGYGLPASLGAALAYRGTDSLVVDIQADGDLLYVSSALWTAARYSLPVLIVVHNNRTYGKDQLHQTEIALARGREPDANLIGIGIDEPAIDFTLLARSQGVEGIGPITTPSDLASQLTRAARTVRQQQRPVLVDVRCQE